MYNLLSLFRKKSINPITNCTFDKDLIDIANEVVSNNIKTAESYFGIKEGEVFQYSMEKLNGKDYVGFTDDTKHNGLWNIRLFHNNMYAQAVKDSKHLKLDTIYVYKAIVAEIFVHELTHVYQYENMGKDYVSANMYICELEAVTTANMYGNKGLYKI